MNLVTALLLFASSSVAYSEVDRNSILPSQLIGKMPLAKKFSFARNAIVNVISSHEGIGVSTFDGTVLVHKSVLNNSMTCTVKFDFFGLELSADVIMIHKDIALLKLDLRGTSHTVEDIPYVKIALPYEKTSNKIKSVGWDSIDHSDQSNIMTPETEQKIFRINYLADIVEVTKTTSKFLYTTKRYKERIGDLLFNKHRILGILYELHVDHAIYINVRELGKITAYLGNESRENDGEITLKVVRPSNRST